MSPSDAVCRSYLDLRWHFDPVAASAVGVTEQDHRLGSFDDTSVGQFLAASRALEGAVEELEVDDPADEIDRTALLDDLRVTIFRLRDERSHARNPAFWLLHLAGAFDSLLGRRDGPPLAAVQDRLKGVPWFLTEARETLSGIPAPWLDAARELIPPVRAGIRRAAVLDDDPGHRTAAADAERALLGFADHLDGLAGEPDGHQAGVGAELFDLLLHHQHAMRAGAPEVWRSTLGLEDQIQENLERLAGDLGEESSFSALATAFETVGPGLDLEQAGQDQQRVIRFLEAAGLVPLSGGAPAIAALPDVLRPIAGHGLYRAATLRDPVKPAAVLLGESPSAAAWRPWLVAELGVPGLHLQMSRAGMATSEVRRHLTSGLLQGGWGLYAVDLLRGAGFGEDDPWQAFLAEAHLLLRVVLARADMALHTGREPFEACVRLMMARFPFEERQAVALVRAVSLAPSAATGTLLGRRELLRLLDDARSSAGDGFDPMAHHEEVLGYGGLPVPLIRWGMGLEE